MDVIARFGEGK
jgi:hypothetical protein